MSYKPSDHLNEASAAAAMAFIDNLPLELSEEEVEVFTEELKENARHNCFTHARKQSAGF